MIKLLLLLSIAAYLAVTIVSAQQSTPADGSLNAVIGSNSGRERHLTGHNGYIGRAGLRPGQPVRVTIDCPASVKGESVFVSSPDGGRVVPPNEALKIKPDRTVSFVFQAGDEHGLYRVYIEAGGQQHLLEFYVLDLEHPGNNPPRVRIVD